MISEIVQLYLKNTSLLAVPNIPHTDTRTHTPRRRTHRTADPNPAQHEAWHEQITRIGNQLPFDCSLLDTFRFHRYRLVLSLTTPSALTWRARGVSEQLKQSKSKREQERVKPELVPFDQHHSRELRGPKTHHIQLRPSHQHTILRSG